MCTPEAVTSRAPPPHAPFAPLPGRAPPPSKDVTFGGWAFAHKPATPSVAGGAEAGAQGPAVPAGRADAEVAQGGRLVRHAFTPECSGRGGGHGATDTPRSLPEAVARPTTTGPEHNAPAASAGAPEVSLQDGVGPQQTPGGPRSHVARPSPLGPGAGASCRVASCRASVACGMPHKRGLLLAGGVLPSKLTAQQSYRPTILPPPGSNAQGVAPRCPARQRLPRRRRLRQRRPAACRKRLAPAPPPSSGLRRAACALSKPQVGCEGCGLIEGRHKAPTASVRLQLCATGAWHLNLFISEVPPYSLPQTLRPGDRACAGARRRPRPASTRAAPAVPWASQPRQQRLRRRLRRQARHARPHEGPRAPPGPPPSLG
jgi:hypothetical protein